MERQFDRRSSHSAMLARHQSAAANLDNPKGGGCTTPAPVACHRRMLLLHGQMKRAALLESPMASPLSEHRGPVAPQSLAQMLNSAGLKRVNVTLAPYAEEAATGAAEAHAATGEEAEQTPTAGTPSSPSTSDPELASSRTTSAWPHSLAIASGVAPSPLGWAVATAEAPAAKRAPAACTWRRAAVRVVPPREPVRQSCRHGAPEEEGGALSLSSRTATPPAARWWRRCSAA